MNLGDTNRSCSIQLFVLFLFDSRNVAETELIIEL